MNPYQSNAAGTVTLCAMLHVTGVLHMGAATARPLAAFAGLAPRSLASSSGLQSLNWVTPKTAVWPGRPRLAAFMATARATLFCCGGSK